MNVYYFIFVNDLDGNALASQSYVKNEIDHLRGVVKCSLLTTSVYRQPIGDII